MDDIAAGEAHNYVLDTFFTLGLLLLIPGAVLLVYGLMQRRAISQEIASGRHRRMSLLGFLVFVAAFTGLVYWGHRQGFVIGGGSGAGEVVPGRPGAAPGIDAGDADAYRAEIAWIPVILVVALSLAAVLAYVVAGRRRPDRRLPGEPAPAEELADVLDETLDDLRAEPDPRRAVVAAFARLERAFGAVGVPRARAETAEEYVARALQQLDVPEGPSQRLTTLYERARFSQHRIDEDMREQALVALTEVRDELRLAASRAELARESGSEEVPAT